MCRNSEDKKSEFGHCPIGEIQSFLMKKDGYKLEIEERSFKEAGKLFLKHGKKFLNMIQAVVEYGKIWNTLNY